MANEAALRKAIEGPPRSRGSALNSIVPAPPPEINNQKPALSSGMMAAPQGAMQPQQQMPAPNHAQTVSALRHFQAIIGELKGLLESDEIGKTDMKSAIIDGTTRLVAERMLSPADAVTQLASVPTRPFEQKQWAQNLLQQTMQARDGVVMHHAMAFAGAPPGEAPDQDDHLQNMQGLMSQYSGGQQ
jgi:hypothetical protein